MTRKTMEKIITISIAVLTPIIGWALVELWDQLVIKENEEQWDAIRGLLEYHLQ